MNKQEMEILEGYLGSDQYDEPRQNELDEQQGNAIVVSSFEQVITKTVTNAQFSIISGRTPKSVIKKRPGKGGKVFSYVPHGYVVAVLNRAFGFDWDFESVPMRNGEMFVYMEEVKGTVKRKGADVEVVMRPASILVHGRLTVRIRNPNNPMEVIATIVKTATGEKEVIRGMTWGGLVKSAESDAFKKAASKMGVALDLYWQDADTDYIPMSPEMIAEQEEMARAEQERNAKADEVIKLHNDGLGNSEIAEKVQLSVIDVVKILKGK